MLVDGDECQAITCDVVLLYSDFTCSNATKALYMSALESNVGFACSVSICTFANFVCDLQNQGGHFNFFFITSICINLRNRCIFLQHSHSIGAWRCVPHRNLLFCLLPAMTKSKIDDVIRRAFWIACTTLHELCSPNDIIMAFSSSRDITVAVAARLMGFYCCCLNIYFR